MKLLDGGFQSSPPLGPRDGLFCGDDRPEDQDATGNQVTILFHTDASVTRTGFDLEFGRVPEDTPESDLEEQEEGEGEESQEEDGGLLCFTALYCVTPKPRRGVSLNIVNFSK